MRFIFSKHMPRNKEKECLFLLSSVFKIALKWKWGSEEGEEMMKRKKTAQATWEAHKKQTKRSWSGIFLARLSPSDERLNGVRRWLRGSEDTLGESSQLEHLPFFIYIYICTSIIFHILAPSSPFWWPQPGLTNQLWEWNHLISLVWEGGREPASLKLVWRSNERPSLGSFHFTRWRSLFLVLVAWDGSLLGHLLLNVLQELIVGRGRLGPILHQVLEQSSFSRSIIPAGDIRVTQTAKELVLNKSL